MKPEDFFNTPWDGVSRIPTTVWDGVSRLSNLLPLCDALRQLPKEELLAAEVTLPLDPRVSCGELRLAQLRRPYERSESLLLVDVSRLPAA